MNVINLLILYLIKFENTISLIIKILFLILIKKFSYYKIKNLLKIEPQKDLWINEKYDLFRPIEKVSYFKGKAITLFMGEIKIIYKLVT